jgi:YfiH family protein
MKSTVTHQGPAQLQSSSALAELRVPHAFTTRVGGVSSPPFDSLNFGNPGELPPGVARDPKANIEANFARVADALGCAGRRIIQVHQVHGAAVHVHASGSGADASGSGRIVWGDVKADAIVTDDPKTLIAVRVADCCPALLSTVDGRVVGAVHAGWRGVVAGVLPAAVRAMRSLSGVEIAAAIGPCISFDAFEVGAEVAEEFRIAFGPAASSLIKAGATPGKWHVDIKAALAEQLRQDGISRFDIDPGCTVGDKGLLFSHRRDAGVTGRMIGIIGPRA